MSFAQRATNAGCPISRSFFARCGIPMRSTRTHLAHYQHLRFRSVVSHISRKTSEIWGTRDLLPSRFSHRHPRVGFGKTCELSELCALSQVLGQSFIGD